MNDQLGLPNAPRKARVRAGRFAAGRATMAAPTRPRRPRPNASRAAFDARAVMEASHDGIFVLDAVLDEHGEVADFRYVAVNDNALRFAGLPTRAEIVGKRMHDLFPALRETPVFQVYRRVVQTKVPERLVVQSVVRTATETWFDIQAVPCRDGIVVNANDITSRKQAELALRESEARFQALVQYSSDFTFVIRPDGALDYASPSVQRLLGFPQDTFIGQPAITLVHPDDHPLVLDRLWRSAAGDPVESVATYRMRDAAGEWHWFESVLTNMLDVPAVRGLVVNARDVTSRKLAEETIRAAGEEVRSLAARYRTLIEQLPAVTYLLEIGPAFAHHCSAYVSPQIFALLGYTPDEWMHDLSGSLFDVMHPDDRAAFVAARAHALTTGELRGLWRLIRKDGAEIWVRQDAKRVRYTQTWDQIWQGVLFDVTEERRAEAEVRFQAKLLDQAPAAVIGVDTRGNVTHWNRFAETLYGWSAAEALGQRLVELIPPAGIDLTPAELDVVPTTITATTTTTYLARRKDGSTVEIEAIVSPVNDEQGRISGHIGVSVDISERKAVEAKLYELAYIDAVTALPNRASFGERLRAATEPARRDGAHAVIIIDLDRFKIVNDSLGHRAGDELLRQVGERFAAGLRSDDLLARFGGDEFAVLCPQLANPTRAFDVATRLLGVLDAPFYVDGRETYVAASAGVTVTGGKSPGDILREADIALYEAKAGGRDRCVVFDPASDERARRRLAQENDLRRALERAEFELHYQPIVALATGELTGVEALLRWRHPTLGLLAPGDFMEVTNETGLIVPIGSWVLAEACRQARAWQFLRPDRPLTVAINVAPRQVRGDGLVRSVWQALSDTGLAPGLVTLELTEEAILDDRDEATLLLETLSGMGVKVAIDDFGTGYSSLGRIHQLPISAVKIDRSFIRGLGVEKASGAVVQAIATLCHRLGIAVTVEGIETDAQWRLAIDNGCEFGQGYLFSKPVPSALIDPLISRGPLRSFATVG